ncbi:putative chloride channel [Streptomyces sp. NBRC 110611]|uniref:chloride channel protein n=1 Tax=Streptomyces sp. NBRC 110611 TaxID=1621259 RepID=UPI000829FE4F|nr:chloride channel protein [Streptomyces sp. NBRC 110611]GAU64823.1 putative chloride channel [Streptomyces sp. NBRC 110611]
MDSFSAPVGPSYEPRHGPDGQPAPPHTGQPRTPPLNTEEPAPPAPGNGLISRLRSLPWTLCGLALLTGAGTAVGAAGVTGLVTALTVLFTTSPDGPAEPTPVLLLTPVLGGLLTGALVHGLAPGTSGIPDLQHTVRHGTRIDPAGPLARALAAAATIGCGGSLGATGPVLHLGAALGSCLHTAGSRLGAAIAAHGRLLAACGAAGGITAVFHAPLAGLLFAIELLGITGATALAATALATTAATAATALLLAPAPLLDLPLAAPPHPAAYGYGLSAALGLLAATAAACLHRLLLLVRRTCATALRASRLPTSLHPACGGLLLGAMLLLLPQLYGTGLAVIGPAAHGRYPAELLLLLLFGKALATSVTLGIGGSGGLLAPLLCLGGLLGTLCGQTAAVLLGQDAMDNAGLSTTMGMAAFVAAALRAPATATLLALELSGYYALALPTAAAALTASLTTRLLFPTPHT